MTTSSPDLRPSVHPRRLFTASCFALIATSVCFGVIGASMGGLKQEFLLSNEMVGWIGGAALWGFTISIFLLGPLVDSMGMRNQMWFAFACHLAGALTMIFAQNFTFLFLGALVLSLGNGTVEAVCNPLVATIYPDKKTEKLNQFHVWFPGGIVIGALASYFLDGIGLTDWRLKIGLIMVPTLVYGYLMSGQVFPETERKASGISFGGMLQGAFGRPLFWVLLFCMALTASIELGPNRWIPAVLEAGGIPGILVLAYISGLMAVLRYFAGPVVDRFSPTGLLLISAILSGVGLYWFSFAETLVVAFLSATVFAVGVCYFWPTMLGVTSERIPRSGALGLSMMGGMGMLAVGLLTSPMMGKIADGHLHQALPPGETLAALGPVSVEYPKLAADLPAVRQQEVAGAAELAGRVLSDHASTGKLPEGTTAAALRAALVNMPPGAEPLVAAIKPLLGQADNLGGRMAFRYVAPFSLILVATFGFLFLRDLRTGGYRQEKILDQKN